MFTTQVAIRALKDHRFGGIGIGSDPSSWGPQPHHQVSRLGARREEILRTARMAFATVLSMRGRRRAV